MNLNQALDNLPNDAKRILMILSGGLDSSVATMLAVHKYGAANVSALSFDYGQKQRAELDKAAELCHVLGIGHKILDIKYFGELVKPMSANIAGTEVAMPTIKDVLGDPQPKTYVPFRNALLLTNALAAAEIEGANYISCGLQATDQYAYWDTTPDFVQSMNAMASINRQHRIQIIAPFASLNKKQEIHICQEMGMEHLLKHTLSCYNPNDKHESCGKCPTCAERVMNFAKAGLKDPVPYSIEIDWDKHIRSHHEA